MKINEKQFEFQPSKLSVDAIFVLRQLKEKFGAKKKKLFLVFVDLEKAFDRMPREAIQWEYIKGQQSVLCYLWW